MANSEPSAGTVFGERLRAARKAAGISQARLAEVAKVAIAQLPLIEAGKARPRIDTARALARGVGARFSELVGD